jgi:hypothetical protein
LTAPQYWQQRNESSTDVGNYAMIPVAMLIPVQIHHVLPIPTRSLSYHCEACIIVLYSHKLPAYASLDQAFKPIESNLVDV